MKKIHFGLMKLFKINKIELQFSDIVNSSFLPSYILPLIIMRLCQLRLINHHLQDNADK